MGWVGAFYATSIGKKIIVAVTGAILILFLVGHMVGNLLVFEGRGPTLETTKLNEYAELLRAEMALLWAVRLGLLTAFVLHVVTTIKLVAANKGSRTEGYAERSYQRADVYSRTMFWGGLALFLYVIYHVLHFTAGTVHAGYFEPHDVYGNVVRSFQNPVIVGVYVLATVALFLHLRHGILSLFQTLGVDHPRHLNALGTLGQIVSAVIVLGFLSVPVSVLLGIVQ